jgi:hypothetical protein
MRRAVRKAVRKAVRAAVAGLCRLSLVACLGTTWLWWRGGRAARDRIEVAAGGVFVRRASSRSGISFRVFGAWPGRAEVRFASRPTGGGPFDTYTPFLPVELSRPRGDFRGAGGTAPRPAR